MQRAHESCLNDILEYSREIDKYKENMAFINRISAFICVHLRLIISPPQRTQRTQSETITLWYEKSTAWRNGTRMTRIGRIFTDTKSVRIRVIRAIRVLSQLLWN